MRVNMVTASSLEYNNHYFRVQLQDKNATNLVNYSLSKVSLKKEKLPSLLKYQTPDNKSLTLKLFTNKLYSSAASLGSRITITTSRPLNKFQFDASKPHDNINGKSIVWLVNFSHPA